MTLSEDVEKKITRNIKTFQQKNIDFSLSFAIKSFELFLDFIDSTDTF